MLSEEYGRPDLSPQEDRRLTELLGQLAGTLIYDSANRHGLLPPYVVQPGDTLDKIAAEHKISPTYLLKVNGLGSASDVRPGATLKVVRGPFNAIVDLRPRREEVTLVLDRRYAGRFAIQGNPGSDFVLPESDTELSVIEKQPQDSWIGFGGKLGIHAESTGRPRGAHDCIRVTQRDAQDLYDLLTPDSKVVIRR